MDDFHIFSLVIIDFRGIHGLNNLFESFEVAKLTSSKALIRLQTGTIKYLWYLLQVLKEDIKLISFKNKNIEELQIHPFM